MACTNVLQTQYIILVLLAPILRAVAGKTMSPSDTLSAIDKITKGIPSLFLSCANFDMIYNSNSKLTPALLLAQYRANHAFLKSSLSTNLIIDLSPTANAKSESMVQLYHENRYHFKFNQPYSLVLFQISSKIISRRSDRPGNSSDYGRGWPEKVVPLLPNPVQRSFVFFCFFERDLKTVRHLVRRVRVFQHFVFLVPGLSGGVSVLKGLSQGHQTNLRQVALYSNRLQVKGMIFVRWLPKLNGASLISVYCISFEPNEEQFAATGIEKSALEVAWRVIHRKANATAEIETLALSPGNGMTVDGEFDEYGTRILDGSAALVGQMEPCHKMQHLIDFTRPYQFDAVGFITGPEKMRNSGSVSVLLDPFGLDVWAVFGLTIFSIILVLELILSLAVPNWSFQVHNGVWIVVFGPMVSQMGSLGYEVKCLSFKLLLGTWLFSLIVIQCEYLCVMTSEIVIHTKVYPPATFSELARSDYGIGAIFWNIIEPQLGESKDPVNLEISWRTLPHDFLDPKCYQMIFEEQKVCLGYQGIFQYTGARYLTDVHGRLMGRLSTETRFFTMTVAGISKFYPFLLEPFTTYISRLDSFGIRSYTAEHTLSLARARGKNYAKDWIRIKKYYQGSEIPQDGEEDGRIISVVIQILSGGFALAFCVLLLELFMKTLAWCIEIKIFVSRTDGEAFKTKVIKFG